ncbi:hypothetical protein Cob_v006731 [Colletotrichum orbiculare MAFF 240422]|uniref:Uncharacterized protein n=1 Tax=Colletotrichum orbiculare (strain 104-T / ATCC 96160 / CBS 514.97 / LARS 414 / MAFF 240422) TaxID=1213857 RepID=A0A484FQC2_COLOR|nr:hypothetical protein Cob_v006731 [Colletotrichum orbiculare MAFF 240422]
MSLKVRVLQGFTPFQRRRKEQAQNKVFNGSLAHISTCLDSRLYPTLRLGTQVLVRTLLPFPAQARVPEHEPSKSFPNNAPSATYTHTK